MPKSPTPTAQQVANEVDVPRWQPGLEGFDWRERLFILLYVSTDGDTLKAYALPYGKAEGWDKRAYAMIERSDIMSGVQRVLVRMQQAQGWNLDEVLGRLQSIADAHMGRFVEIDADGVVSFDLRTITETDWRAVKSLTVKGRGPSQEIKLELHDAAAALTTLGKHYGMGLGTVKVIEDEKRERAKLAGVLGALSDEQLADLERIGRVIESQAGVVIDGDSTLVEEEGDDAGDGDGA